MALGDIIDYGQQPVTEEQTPNAGSTGTDSSGSSGSIYSYGTIDEYVDQNGPTGQYANQNEPLYAEGTPTNVTEAYQQLSEVWQPTQEYANEWQDQIIRDYNGYQTQETYQGKFDRNQTEQLYNYLADKQQTADYTAWTAPNPQDELFTNILPDWEVSNREIAQYEQELGTPLQTEEDKVVQSVYQNTTSEAQRAIMDSTQIQKGDWNTLSTLDKAKYLLMPGSSATTYDNAPDWAKYIQNIMPSVMAAGAGTMVGSLIPIPYAGLVVGAAVGGLTYLQGVTNLEVPVLNRILEAIDMPSVWTEQGQGAVGAALTVAGMKQNVDLDTAAPLLSALKYTFSGDVDAIELAKETADILRDPANKYLWEVGKFSYEASADWGFDDLVLAGRNAIAKFSDEHFGTDIGQRESNEVSRANIGRGGLEETVEGTQDYGSLINTYLPIYTGLVEGAMNQLGYDEKAAIAFADQNFEQYMLNYMGTSGLGRDLLASSIADPENLIPYASGKAAETIGKATGDTSMINAGRAAVGNPLIDLLPPGAQQIAEGALSAFKKNGNAPDIFKTYGSQGFDVIKDTYAKNLQSTVPVDSMSWLQRNVAGVTDAGTLKGFDARPESDSVKNWVSNMVNTTNETRMLNLSQLTTDFLGSALFDGKITPEQIPTMILQITGKMDIGDDSPLAPYRGTAVLNTIQEGWAGLKDNSGIYKQISNDVDNFRSFNTERGVLKHVAQELSMTEKEVLDALKNRTLTQSEQKTLTKGQKKQAANSLRKELFDKIREAGITYTDPVTGKVFNTENVVTAVNKFQNNQRMYSMDYFKASIMERLSRVADQHNLMKYNIQPDSWAFRLSELTKSVQSISLLNFSSSYMVNNFLNNMLTRGAVGIGGIDFVGSVTGKRGLQFSRDTDAYKATGQSIKKAKNTTDALSKVDKLYRNFTNENTLLGKFLKGVNNLDIEGMETRAAFDIGTNRYWEATWSNNIPAIPDVWKTVGITDDMSKQIYKIALDSPTIDVFADKLMGEVVIPGARSTFDAMTEKYYTPEAAKILKDRFSTMPEIFDYMDKFLETGDVNQINKAFDNLQDQITRDLNMKNLVQAQSEFNNLKVRYSSEGFAAIGTAMEAIGDLYSDIWIDQTKVMGTTFLDRAVGRLTKAEADAVYEANIKTLHNDYNIARGYAVKNIGAAIAGLGLESDFSKALLINMMKQIDIADEYIQVEHALYQKYAVTGSDTYDFKYYQSSKIDALTKVLSTQLDATKEMDAMLVKYLRDSVDPSYAGQIDIYERIVQQIEQKKEAYNKQQIADLQKRMNARDIYTREKVSLGQEKARLSMKQEIDQLHTQAAQQFKALENTVTSRPINQNPLTLEEALKLELFYEEANQSTKNQGEFLKHYEDKSNPKKVFEPISFENRGVKTSFRNFADNQIRALIANDPSLGSFLDVKTEIYNAFMQGEAVPLGATANVYSDMKTSIPIGTEYKLLNPDANVSGAEYTMARTQPFDYNGQRVNAGVYRNGNLIGYITSGMQETIVVDGKTYPVIGISKTDPKTYLVMVNDQVWRINPEKPKNFDYTYYATENFHPGSPGSTPTTQPWGTADLETSPAMREAINLWKDQAIADLQDARTNGSLFGKLNDTQREAVFQWVDRDLRQAYSSQRFQTQRYGETMVDAALLNYNQRYGFDNMFTMIMPYQFWMTRSVANWGKRMVTQPAWYSMYSRLEKLIEKNKKDFYPSRLEGMVGIPMPNMGDGMGSSLFMDISNIIFPFKQFYDTGEYFIKNLGNVHQNTLREIEQMYNDGKITSEQYDEAMQARGDLYWQTFEDQRKKDEADVSIGGLMGEFLSPSVPVQAIYKHLTGHDKDISYTPAYQLGTMIKGIGDDTPFQGVTDFLGNAIQYPEKQLRSLIGADTDPYGSNYTDYYINYYIANMVTDRQISRQDAINALIEGEGNPIYDEAAHRFLEQQTIRKQGGALLAELGQSLGENKETSAGQIAGSALASIFGAKILPYGEQQYRKDQAYKNVVVNRLGSDSESYKQFWKDNPDYVVHGWGSIDDPEEKLHTMLVQNLSDTYYALPSSQQLAVQQGLGKRFEYYFLDKETRAMDMIPDEEIIQWTRAMQGNVPQFSNEELNKPAQEAQQIKWYSSSVQAAWDKYQRDKKAKFPGIDTIEDGYYAIPANKTSAREKYKKANPSLEQYWKWNDSVKNANPQLYAFTIARSAHYSANVYGNYDSVTEAIMSKVNDYARNKIYNYINYGYAIPADVEKQLKAVYMALDNKSKSYSEWKKSLAKKWSDK